ncbi:MAG TPA: glycosyltransferase family 4 protein, partial [bacterium]|nr:glycosyltransferase family 4 protein [bacterium]
ISFGRLVHWKVFALSIAAFAKFQNSAKFHCEYVIIGTGPEKKYLLKKISEYKLQDLVQIIEPIERQELWDKFKDFQVFLNSSLHDQGPFVLVEAMAAGLPIITLDLGGSSIIVDKKSGFKIKAKNPEQAVEEFKNAMLALQNRDVWLEKSIGAKQRIKEEFVSDRYYKSIEKVYHSLIR